MEPLGFVVVALPVTQRQILSGLYWPHERLAVGGQGLTQPVGQVPGRLLGDVQVAVLPTPYEARCHQLDSNRPDLQAED